MRVFIDEQSHEVQETDSVESALAGFDAGLARAVAEGRAYVTDGVGRPVDPGASLHGGAILRVVRAAPRPDDAGT